MRAVRVTGLAYLRDYLTSLYSLARKDVGGTTMTVERYRCIRVNNHDEVAVTTDAIVAVDHETILHGANRRAFIGRNVEARMRLATRTPRPTTFTRLAPRTETTQQSAVLERVDPTRCGRLLGRCSDPVPGRRT